ncbi:hypothetical protein Stsp02_19830 [Streptomyces sp. NBRC 14336]|uniref:hypothetical protein n=1 Tax=Streptomyces sp. NBRC 14336 TaxID=3030992 RepID=UPI0024A0A456|nr:hypothetical protein [Streptomyces sp. NBRC 14336]WBO81734.1 hypothetical protein SBE_005611 [Streptomyces sp. SBE_14.2]GLW46321.1 hypothetical protein Stsp02_19830 [Streptomyces sp. NBRC 14336]
MSATATLLDAYCIRAATGTDAAVNEAVGALAAKIPLNSIGTTLQSFVSSVPQVVAAIDTARSDPDNLYITTSTEGDLANAVWPGNGSPGTVGSGQTQPLGVSVPVDFVQNVSLWDHDDVSSDDLLGSIRIEESERGEGPIARLATSSVEGSLYYVTYRVD